MESHVSVLNERPQPWLVDLPTLMEHWTLREYVALARLRAEGEGLQDRVAALSQVLDMVDKQEQSEAARLASAWSQGKMTDANSRLFQQTIRGRVFNVFAATSDDLHMQMLNAALYRLQPTRLQEILQEEPHEVNPLRTREDVALACHPETMKWPLRVVLYARLSAEAASEQSGLVAEALSYVREWEDQLVHAVYFSTSNWLDRQKSFLQLLLKESA